MPTTTIYHEVDDLYDPDMDAMIEVEIEVSYNYSPADPDVGIMCGGAEDICVISTDCDLFGEDQAQWWLDRNEKEREYVHEAAWEAQDEGPDPDYERDRRRDDRLNP